MVTEPNNAVALNPSRQTYVPEKDAKMINTQLSGIPVYISFNPVRNDSSVFTVPPVLVSYVAKCEKL